MKTTLITGALVMAASLLTAQTNSKEPVKVRIKKVENINGVEKITDTTFTTTDPASLSMGNDVQVISGGNGGKVVIVKSHSGDGESSSSVKVLDSLDEEIEKALKEAGVDSKDKSGKKVIIVNSDAKAGEGNDGTRTISKIVIVKTGLNDANSEECRKAGIPTSKEKLLIEDMSCTPNPSNGKFTLKFSGGNKAPAEITVKDSNGKTVYSENVKNFNGSYEKEINLDKENKGIYFVTISQGAKSTTKKVVVE